MVGGQGGRDSASTAWSRDADLRSYYTCSLVPPSYHAKSPKRSPTDTVKILHLCTHKQKLLRRSVTHMVTQQTPSFKMADGNLVTQIPAVHNGGDLQPGAAWKRKGCEWTLQYSPVQHLLLCNLFRISPKLVLVTVSGETLTQLVDYPTLRWGSGAPETPLNASVNKMNGLVRCRQPNHYLGIPFIGGVHIYLLLASPSRMLLWSEQKKSLVRKIYKYICSLYIYTYIGSAHTHYAKVSFE